MRPAVPRATRTDRRDPQRAAQARQAEEATAAAREGPRQPAGRLVDRWAVRRTPLRTRHGGTYRGNFTSRLTGTSAAPITVRGATGERAVLDGVPAPSRHVLTVNGAHVIFRDIEVTNSHATRVITNTGSNPTDARGEGVGMYGQGVKLVNLVIHDTGQGVGNWSAAPDGEVYGCIIFYNGWTRPTTYRIYSLAPC
jgi:hypothetical protein